MSLAFTLTDTPDPDDLAAVNTALSAFNDADAQPADMIPLAVFVREGDAIVAGLSGNTAWGWLYVRTLFVSEAKRGQGLAGAMLAQAEAEAVARGCHGAYIDTFSPIALKTYQKAGYAPFGALPDFPRGRTRTFLSKRLHHAL